MNAYVPGGHPKSDQLSEYLDGDLGAPERETIARHLEACAPCAATLAELMTVRDRARTLPPLSPPDSLWEAIEARLPAKARVLDFNAAREQRRWSFTTPQLAAAAAALMVVSGTAAWFAGRPAAPERTGAGSQPVAVTARPFPSPPSTASGDDTTARSLENGLETPPMASRSPERESRPARGAAGVPATAANFGVERYDTAIADLERILAQNRSRLSPTTVQVVEKNLALIDGAIEDARRALAADPASPYLNDHLAETMKRKVDLLRRVTSRLQS